jgi:hypothetical protein
MLSQPSAEQLFLIAANGRKIPLSFDGAAYAAHNLPCGVYYLVSRQSVAATVVVAQ